VIKTFELDFFKHNFEIKLASKHPHVAVEAPEKVAMNKYTIAPLKMTQALVL